MGTGCGACFDTPRAERSSVVNGRLVSILALTLPVLAGACNWGKAGPSGKQVRGGAVVITEQAARAVPYAPAGASFDVHLDEGIDTRISSPGQAITATLAQPIAASDGDVLVPAGARLRGRVAAIERTEGPRIDLEFDSLVLGGGAVPIGVRVLSAQESRYRSLPAQSGVTNAQPSTDAQAAPPPAGSGTLQISLARGAAVRVALTTPVVDGRALR